MMKIRASVVRPGFVKATVLLIDGREITIDWYLKRLNIDSTMRKKLNRFRQMVGNAAI